ncbi:MAG: efflux RND transporter periplasmic adaptor subunit [Planctomycetia bacterium]|nr:efflux RND transporter periplasmic adaptor subunit [Planctomycetia bacterium]
MSRKVLTVVLSCLLLAGSVFQVFAQAPGKMPPMTVRVGKVVARNPVVAKKYVGAFEAIEKVDSIARVSGFITKVNFKEGDLVKKGDLLFEIEQIRYQAAYDSKLASVAQATATIEQAEASIVEIEARIRYAQSTNKRNEDLFKSGAAVSQDEVENTQSQLKVLTAQLEAAKAQLEAAKAQLASAQAAEILAKDDLGHTKIYAMITGRAGRLTYTLGNYVTPSSQPLITVVQMDPMYVRFSMSEKDFTSLFGNVQKLRESANLKIQLADGKIYDQPGEIAFLDNTVKTSVDSIQIWAKFPNPDELLNAGGIVRVHLSKVSKETKPAVKVSAVMHDTGGAYVYVLGAGNKVERRSVTLGTSDGLIQTVFDGVDVGETVITDGTHKVVPGMVVQPVPEEDEAKDVAPAPAKKEAGK